MDDWLQLRPLGGNVIKYKDWTVDLDFDIVVFLNGL